MEKFMYTITVHAPSKGIADMVMDSICKEQSEFLKFINDSDTILNKAPEEKIETPEKTGKEKFLEGLKEFQTVLQIVEKCVADNKAIDSIAEMLGINVPPLKKTQP